MNNIAFPDAFRVTTNDSSEVHYNAVLFHLMIQVVQIQVTVPVVYNNNKIE
jgi:hypothetical protein